MHFCPPALDRMSTFTNKCVKGVDMFIDLCHKTADVIVRGFDELNGVPSHKQVSLKQVLDDDKNHRINLFEEPLNNVSEESFYEDSEESLYDVFGHDKYTDEENPTFCDDEVVITFFDYSGKIPMIGNLIKSPKLDNSVFMGNTLSAESSFLEIISKYLESIGMTFEFNSLLSDSYTFSMETSHWKLEVRLSRHCQPQWLFIVKNQWFLTNSEIVEELESIYDSTIQILEDLQKSQQKPNSAFFKADAIFNEFDFSSSQSPKKVDQPQNVLLTDYHESNVFIGFWMLMKLFFTLFHSQKCGLLWAAREILSQELLAGQLTGFYQSLRGLFIQILSSHLLSGQLCCLKKVRGLFHQILSSDLLSGQLCYLKKTRGLFYTDSLFC